MKYTPDQEKLIVSKIKSSDTSAFKALYLYAYNRLCVYILNFTKDESAAEDIVQETFTKLWIRRKKLKADLPIMPYLYKMTYNEFVDVYRKNKKFDQVLEAFKIESLQDLLENDEQLFKERLKRVQEAIEELPIRCKEIFELNKRKNMSYKDIAERLGISIKTVENQIGKALKVIRAKVAKNNPINLFLNFLRPCRD